MTGKRNLRYTQAEPSAISAGNQSTNSEHGNVSLKSRNTSGMRKPLFRGPRHVHQSRKLGTPTSSSSARWFLDSWTGGPGSWTETSAPRGWHPPRSLQGPVARWMRRL